MKKHEFKYELGLKARDVITGFQGIIVHRVNFITGCDNYGLQPQNTDEDNKIKDIKQFDENRIEILGEGVKNLFDQKPEETTKKSPTKVTGGPQLNVGKQH
jgi:hypothetical protein